jgi:hypothetical protein
VLGALLGPQEQQVPLVLPQQLQDQLVQQALKEHQSMFEEVLQLLEIFH